MPSSRPLHNLTLPISAQVGGVFPWEAPLETEDIATIERNRAHLFFISMGSGIGTRLRTAGFGRAGAARVVDLELGDLVERDAVVLRIPTGQGEAIAEQHVVAALRSSGPLEGSAVVLVTGWGDGRRWEAQGEAYSTESPHLAPAAAELLADEMEARGSDLLLTDCAHLDRPGGEFARAEWLALAPWQRPPWPSDLARAYLRHYAREKVEADWAASLALTRRASVVVGLVNCGALAGATARFTVLPMFVEGVAEAPCTVVAQDGNRVIPTPPRSGAVAAARSGGR